MIGYPIKVYMYNRLDRTIKYPNINVLDHTLSFF